MHIVLLDTSASLLNQQGLSHAKGILNYLSQQLHLQQDLLTVLTFGNQQVKTVYPIQTAPRSFDAWLSPITGGGGTPLNQALQTVWQLSQKYRQQTQVLYILTDARSHENLHIPKFSLPITVIDMESHPIRLGKAQQLAQFLHAEYITMQQLDIVN